MNASIDRRQFLRYSFYSGAFLVAAPYGMASDNSQQSDQPGGPELSPLIRIDKNNHITFYSPSPEMGQGTNTALAMLFAEELGADMARVSSEPLPFSIMRDEKDNVTWKAVPQFAGGSTSISRNWPLLRQAGASTRQLFIQAAAQVFGSPEHELSIRDSHLIVPGEKKSIPLAELSELAAQQTLPDEFNPQLKTKEQWQLIGKPHNAKGALAIVTGKPLYGMDMTYPDAKVAVIARSPYFDGEVENLDSNQAAKMPGVVSIVELPRPDTTKMYTYLAAGVAVVADTFWHAKKARDALKITWKKGPFADASTDRLHQQCDEQLKQQGQIVRNDGDFVGALNNAESKIQHTYRIPLVSHAQLEPQNCIAHVTDSSCTIIGPMQSPGGAGRIAEAITGHDRVKMDIRYTRLGGGFGRRLSNDHVAEAVTVSKLSGYPVQLMWTREDDLRHDYYRPMAHHQLTAGVDKDGKVVAWSHHYAGTPKYYRRDNVKPEELFRADIYVDDFPSGRVDNLQYQYSPIIFGAPQGSWRAPAHTANAFVVESFLDEVAEQTHQDPLTLRLNMLGEAQQLPYSNHGGPHFDTGRLAVVLQAAADKAQWGRNMASGMGQGIAGHFTFGGYCACVVEVTMLDEHKFRVDKVYAAIDVGQVVNPEGIKAQVEGGLNDGLSTALGQQIEVEDGQVVNDNFDRYKMMRMADSIRSVEVTIIDSDLDPVGVGEMAIPVLAPALANAIKAAGGKRIRHHPMQS
ncbi:MAG: molybdopterin cofactor-binding domain-containing protein [Aestuariibacter sp.]